MSTVDILKIKSVLCFYFYVHNSARHIMISVRVIDFIYFTDFESVVAAGGGKSIKHEIVNPRKLSP